MKLLDQEARVEENASKVVKFKFEEINSRHLLSARTITRATSIKLKLANMRWKAKIKSYNFHVEAKSQL
jgi:hypothetical protein